MLSKFQKRKAERLYQVFDANEDGLLTYDDVYMRAKSITDLVSATPQEAELKARELDAGLRPWWDHLTQMDRNANGEITLPEWLHGFEEYIVGDMVRTDSLLRPAAAGWFAAGDADNDDVLNRAEFQALWLATLELPAEESGRAFDNFTLDESGLLTKKAYIQTVVDFFLSDDIDSPSQHLLGALK